MLICDKLYYNTHALICLAGVASSSGTKAPVFNKADSTNAQTRPFWWLHLNKCIKGYVGCPTNRFLISKYA